MSKEYDHFMNMDTTPYSGEWIGICGSTVVSHSRSFKEAYAEAKKVCKGSPPFVALVPSDQAMLL